MALQVYRCPDHGEFDVNIPLTQDVPQFLPCIIGPAPFSQTTACGQVSPWVLKAPSAVIIKGGSGDRGLDRDAQQLAGEKLRAKERRRRSSNRRGWAAQ